MSILVVIVGISLLIFVHELGHFLAAKKFGLLVQEFGFGFPPRIFSKKIGETTYSLNLLPFGGFVRIYGEDREAKTEAGIVDEKRSFAHQSWLKRAAIVIAGVVMNFFLGWALLSLVFMIGTPKVLLASEIVAGTPAEAVGIKVQDQLEGFTGAQAFIDFVNQNRGKEITLNLRRDGQELSVKATPRLKDSPALGVAVVEAGIERKGFFSAIFAGLRNSITMVGGIFAGFGNLIYGLLTHGKALVDVVGPVGIFGVANQAGALGFAYLVQLIALISLNLMVLNVLPFPALDGGRLLFVLIEKIKGSPISGNIERNANAIGFIVLLLLMITVTARDLIRLF